MLMGPGTIGLAATQVNIFVNTLLATSQGTGAVSWLTYAFRLMYLPIGLFGVSIATAVLPAVSRHAAVGDTAGIRDTVSRGLGMMLMLNVPATVGLCRPRHADRAAAVRARPVPAGGHGGDCRGGALLRVGLVGYSAARIASPTFYAIGDSRVPAMVSGGAIAVNVIASVALVRAIGFRRPGAWHVDRGDRERGRAGVAAAPPARRPRRPASGDDAGQGHRRRRP